jgi:hypothetical protein
MDEKCFKNIEGDYIVSISTGTGAEEIKQEEYDNIMSVIRSRPTPEVGYDYRLRADLTWELIEVEIIPEDEVEISDDEFMNMVEEVL